MISTIVFDPLIPLLPLALLAALALALVFYAGWQRLAGWMLRALAALVLLTALANPSLRFEERLPLSDIAFVVIDQSSSQAIDVRPEQITEARAEIEAQLGTLATDPRAPLEWRVLEVGDTEEAGRERGTHIIRLLETAASEVSADRIAGAIIVSDGQVHDADLADGFPAPVHLLLTGRESEWDRRLVVETAPSFGIVGEDVEMRVRVEQRGDIPPDAGEMLPLRISVDGEPSGAVSVRAGESVAFSVPITHGGLNVLQLTVDPAETELTDRNNSAIISINGVRDRLRVLLVSGEPHAGGRTWRNLLKADPSVDLVHFTILRPPTKQDGVPVFEMSLIAFPTRELFMQKIDEFDLIIFDRYRRRGVLPTPYLQNIARYVEDGGAVLVASGPAFAGVESLHRTPLRSVLPAAPTARVFEEGYVPRITDVGRRHPVTEGLEEAAPRPTLDDGTPGWGRWFRMIDMAQESGHAVMSGPDDRPLLIMDRPGEGRIAVLASDHAWLWSRGYEGGGPQSELLRRLAHWLMKEPELEEDALTAVADGREVRVERRTLDDISPDLSIETPSGETLTAEFVEVSPGKWQAEFTAPENGIYRLDDGLLQSVAAVGPSAPKEFEDPLSTGALLASLTDVSLGSVERVDGGVPDIRRVREGRSGDGRGWIGLHRRDAYQVQNISLTPLAPAWLVLALTAFFIVAAWRIEGR
ncbi:MAG: hypothetical protein AAFR57_09745 [Pseudomonadota bacterium]